MQGIGGKQKELVKECALSALLSLYSRFPEVEGLELDTRGYLVLSMGQGTRKRAQSQTDLQEYLRSNTGLRNNLRNDPIIKAERRTRKGANAIRLRRYIISLQS